MGRSTITGRVRPQVGVGLVVAAALAVGGCGGGGESQPAATVTFEGFSFRLTETLTVVDPPFEQLSGALSFGAPLDTVVVFHFSGAPQGPLGPATLPVWTTPDEIGVDVPLVPGQAVPAKGEYVAVGDTVEFRPYVPTAPLDPAAADPAAVPGLLPATTYHASVLTGAGTSLGNLVGPGGHVAFGTTSIEAAYYPPGETPYAAPAVVEASDAPLAPRVFDDTPYDFAPTVDAGAEVVELVYDRALMPTVANLEGVDADGDGWIEPTWSLRVASSDVLLGLSSGGLAALEPDVAAPVGAEAIVAGSPDGAPTSLAFDADGAVLFALLADDAGNTALAAIDHATGDARGAAVSNALDVPPLAGLTAHVDGRLLALDLESRRVVEVRAAVTRSLPAGPPLLDDVTIGPDDGLFAGEPWPADVDVVDLVGHPDGRLLALVSEGDGAPRRLVETVPFDPTASGSPAPDAGWPTGDVVLTNLSPGIVDVAAGGPATFLALDVDLDAVVALDATSGASTPLVVGLGALGGPDVQPRCLARARAHHDVDVELLENAPQRAVVTLRPRGLLPFGASFDVLQSPTLASLVGTHDVNTADDAPPHRLGRRVVHSSTTTDTTSAPGATVHDVFLESFDDDAWQSAEATTLPAALWAAAEADGTSSSALQPAPGTVAESLGDFRPLPSPAFDPDVSLDANVVFVYLDTGSQTLPHTSGATPDVTVGTTITGGRFVFDDFVVPEGVCVKVSGPEPLDILALGDVRIDGVVDVSGVDGLGDDTFDTGFFPVPGGAGGPAAGRGGNGHPTRSDPNGPGTIDQYVTPETGEQGFGPTLLASGALGFASIGGRGGLSTLGYDPDEAGYPRVPAASNQFGAYNGNEHHRPPGGGGGSFAIRGRRAHEGTGAYLVESDGSWFPFSRCTVLDKQTDALYGNEANLAQGLLPNTPLQCVYLDGTPADPVRTKPGGRPGDAVFVDDDPDNDFIGPGGELDVLFGGQGGGGGGSRIDSMDHLLWSADKVGSPTGPGYPYPKLFANIALSPTRYDAKGGGGGGGGGALRIRAQGHLRIGRTGRIDASGGKGGGGEIVQASSWAGGGGGGSGGAVLLSAAGELVLEADPGNRLPSVPDADGARGATIDVSGGLGKDARTSPRYHTSTPVESGHASRSDGGQGGFGLVQLTSAQGAPRIEQGAFVGARVRAMLKLGAWVDPTYANFGAPFDKPGINPSASDHPFDKEPHPRELWYYDLLHYRGFRYEDDGQPVRDLVLNGADPPIIDPHPSVAPGPYQLDTPMTTYLGRRYVREPEPHFVLASWFGLEDDAEILDDPDGDGPLPPVPGTFFAPDADIPLNIDLDEPSGTPLYETVDGQQRLALDNLVPRLPLVHPDSVPFDLTLASEARSRWLDLHGAALRPRDASGRAPPFFDALHGTLTTGYVETSAPVPGLPAEYVANTPGAPFDPGLTVDGTATGEPYNDVEVDAEEWGLPDALGTAADVRVVFQGAFGVRPGSSTPDPDTFTEWTGDLAALSGYPLVRFRVVFTIDGTAPAAQSDATYPRPSVDRLRLRLRY